jgi:predicted GIY-YIG superfamily endonuclease
MLTTLGQESADPQLHSVAHTACIWLDAVSRYTRSRLPVTLEYQEEQPNQSLALKRELAIKAMSRKAKEALVRLAKGRDVTT